MKAIVIYDPPATLGTPRVIPISKIPKQEWHLSGKGKTIHFVNTMVKPLSPQTARTIIADILTHRGYGLYVDDMLNGVKIVAAIECKTWAIAKVEEPWPELLAPRWRYIVILVEGNTEKLEELWGWNVKL